MFYNGILCFEWDFVINTFIPLIIVEECGICTETLFRPQNKVFPIDLYYCLDQNEFLDKKKDQIELKSKVVIAN